MEEKVGASIQKVATLILPSRKSKVIAEEDQEDGVRMYGKISRCITPTRSSMSVSNEKLDSVATSKQMRSARINYDKIESKLGRSLTNKWSEHKGYTHPRHSITGPPSSVLTLMEDEPEKYQSHFSEYIMRGIEADNMEELYKKVHAAIRADPMPSKSTKEPPKEHKRYNLKKLTYEERKAKLIERLNSLISSAGADDEEDKDEDNDE